jgi:RsiW-degrading membrane proteinase PrsW (M82 family)
MILLFIVIVVFLVIAALLTWFLLANDHGEKEPVSALWLAAGFGILGTVLAGILESRLIPRDLIGASHTSGSVLFANLSVGVIEEACKFLPLAFFIYRKSYFNEHTDGVIYFALAGLGFGIPENILYTVLFGSGTGIGRLAMTPIFHACTTSMVGYFLVKAKIEHKSLVKPGIALVAAMLVHGFYDFGLSSGNVGLALLSLLITIGLTISFFLFYMKANELDRARGLSAVGHTNFCRACGSPNPNHNLYCTHCGQRA